MAFQVRRRRKPEPGLRGGPPATAAVLAGTILFAAVAPGFAAGAERTGLRLSSPAFEPNGSIPTRFACNGADVSPPLRWSGIPEGTETLALIVDDPDAPRGVWVHWVAYNLSPDPGGLEAAASGSLPEPAREGRNSWGSTGYGGPCPPSGAHRYVFKLYALDASLDLDKPDKPALLQAMEGHTLGHAELVGRYAR